jgi:ferredoxin
MIDQERITAIQELFGRKPIWLQENRCLNARHRKAGCTRCEDACPSGAIVLDDGNPVLDLGQCVRCGICLHECPTDVFNQRNVPENVLAQTVRQLVPKPTGLACSIHPEPGLTDAPVAGVVRHQRCLGALSPEQLLGLSRDGERILWLDDTICDRCPIGEAQTIIVQSAAAANRLLEAAGRPRAIHVQSAEDSQRADHPEQRPVLNGMQPRLSRRGLFGALGQFAKEKATEAADFLPDPEPEGPVPVEERLPYRVPRSRERLLARMAHLLSPEEPAEGTSRSASVPVHDIPFAQVSVAADACSGCGLCARFCPTGALAFHGELLGIGRSEDHPEPFALSFRAAICIDCGICAIACPDDAIRFGEELPVEDLISDDYHELIRGELIPCASCGALTARRPTDEQALCYACRYGAGTVRPLQDRANLFADLLKRLAKEDDPQADED